MRDVAAVGVHHENLAVGAPGGCECNRASADDETLHVLLVNHSFPDPRESFYVNFGLQYPQQERIELIATIRVEIVDDDSR